MTTNQIEEIKETLRKIYYGDNEAFTPKVMSQLSLIIWKAEQYDKNGENMTYCVSCDKKTNVKINVINQCQTETECVICGLTQSWGITHSS